MSETARTGRGEHVPVETVVVGELVFVGRITGWRNVLELRHYEAHGPAPEGFVVIYDPPGPGTAWENRAKAKGVVSFFNRDSAALATKRRGDLLEVWRGE